MLERPRSEIMMSMPSTIEFDDALPTCHRSGQSQSMESGFRTGRRKAHHFRRRHIADDPLSQIDRSCCKSEVMSSHSRMPRNRLCKPRMRMTKDKRATTHEKIEELSAVRVIDIDAFPSNDEK